MNGLYLSTDIPASQECRCRRLWFFHQDVRAFTTSWLPQPVFLVWRLFASLYLLGWLVADIILHKDIGVKWLIYYSNLAYVLLVMTYLMLATLTLLFTVEKYSGKKMLCLSRTPGEYDAPPEVYDHDYISFFVKLVWFLWINSLNITPGILITFYTSVLDNPISRTDAAVVHVNGINLVIILVDVLVSRMPVQILHFVWGGSYGILYVIFTGIYFAAGGTGQSDKHIYQALDYESIGKAIGWALFFGLNAIGVHFIWWIIVFLRDLLYKTCGCCYRDITETPQIV